MMLNSCFKALLKEHGIFLRACATFGSKVVLDRHPDGIVTDHEFRMNFCTNKHNVQVYSISVGHDFNPFRCVYFSFRKKIYQNLNHQN